MDIPWRRIKPGWYLLIFLLLYSVGISIALSRSNSALRELRLGQTQTSSETKQIREAAVGPGAVVAPEGLWFPIPGARIPENPAYLPGAERSYRQGVNQGFDFYGSDIGIPVSFGTPVVAAANSTVVRADNDYREQTPESWQELLTAVANGASEEQLDLLRGRQIWLKLDDGRTLRYGHLSGIAPGVVKDKQVYRGQVIGFVGNSGTDDGVAGKTSGVRLRFELWLSDGTFFGQGMAEEDLRLRAASLFVGP